MKQHRWLTPVLILLGFVFLSPTVAKADSVALIEQLLDVVHVADSSIPDGHTLDPVLRCLQNPGPNMDLDACANAIGGDGTSPYLDSVMDVIQIFEDLSKSDYDGVLGVVVKWLGSDAPCIVADIMFPGGGGDLCELAKELIEAAVEVGQDIAVFFADVGEGLYDVGKAVYCAFADCSSSSPPQEPPQQVIYEACFEPQLDNGLHALENKGYAALDQIVQGSQCHIHSIPNVPDLSTYFYQAGDLFKKQVQANWAADMPKTVIPQLLIKRQAIGFPDVFQWWLTAANKMAQTWANPWATAPVNVNSLLLPTADAFAAKVGPECVSAFTATNYFAEVDTWIKDYPDQAKQIVEYGQPGLLTNAQWCDLQTRTLINAGVLGNSYQPPNCPAMQKQGSPYAYRCNTLVDYGQCWAVKARAIDVHAQNPCGFNVPAVGKEVVSGALTGIANCKVTVIDSSPATDTPVQVGCIRPVITAAAQAQYASHYNLPVTLVSFKTVPDPRYEANMGRVNAIVWLISHGQDPHGNLPPPVKYAPEQTKVISAADMDASKKRLANGIEKDQGTIKLKDSKTATVYANSSDKLGMVSSDVVNGKVRDPSANHTTVVTIGALPKACENRIQVSDFDPMVVLAELCVFNKLEMDPNQDFGFKWWDQKSERWYYLGDVVGSMDKLKQRVHPSDFSSETDPVLVYWWPNTDSENRFSKPQ